MAVLEPLNASLQIAISSSCASDVLNATRRRTYVIKLLVQSAERCLPALINFDQH